MAPVGHGPKLTSVGQPHSSIRIYSGGKGWLKESTTDACYTNKKIKTICEMLYLLPRKSFAHM